MQTMQNFIPWHGSEGLVWSSGCLLRGNEELPELNFPGLQLKRTGEQLRLAQSSGNPLTNPRAQSRAPGAGCLGSSCHQNSPKTGQIKLLNTNTVLRRALFITGLVARGITPPCVHVIFYKCVAYIQPPHACSAHYHKALPNFPGSVLVLAVAAFLSQMSSPYLPTALAEKADPVYPVSC